MSDLELNAPARPLPQQAPSSPSVLNLQTPSVPAAPAFGGHNFYAGYTTKAIIQLCLTVLTCFIGSVVSWIWAIVEACVINQDNEGIEFV